MKSTITPASLAALLKRVPEKRFRITELAPQLLTGGQVDIEKCMERQNDINLAVQEVRTYINGVNSLRKHLYFFGRYRSESADEIFGGEDEEVEEEDGL